MARPMLRPEPVTMAVRPEHETKRCVMLYVLALPVRAMPPIGVDNRSKRATECTHNKNIAQVSIRASA
jgi:hypothetical protein